MNPERITDGRSLFEITATYAEAVQIPSTLSWEELPWNDQDAWEARADEINESRRD